MENISRMFIEPLRQDYSDKVRLDSKARSERLELFIFVVLGGLLPVTLILTGIIPYDQRFNVIFVIAAGILILEKALHISWHDLGFRRDTLRSSLIANGLLSLVFGVILLAVASTGIIRHSTIGGPNPFYVFYIVILAPIQELLFRSVIFAEFKRSAISRPSTRIILSAAIFVIPHLIYRDYTIIAVAAFIGLVWGWIYNRYPNWVGVAISHAILGAISIAVGLI